jgi:hypothetical protein
MNPREAQLRKLIRAHLTKYYEEKMSDPKFAEQKKLDGKNIDKQIEESIKFYEELSEPIVAFILTLATTTGPSAPHVHKII